MTAHGIPVTSLPGFMRRGAFNFFDYAAEPKETLTECPLCAGPEFVEVATRDRYRLPVRAVSCTICGLCFLNPRMTREAYARFYQGMYRRLVTAYSGIPNNAKSIQENQRVYAAMLEQFLSKAGQGRRRKPHVKTILDIGGSTGVVARHLAQALGARATILDPSPTELAEASGLEVIQGLIEDFDPGERRWSLVLLCQTVDHLTDVAGTLRKIRKLLSNGGFLFVDILDYSQTRQIKVDHPFNLTRDTMEQFLSLTGFRVVQCEATSKHHVGYLCEAA